MEREDILKKTKDDWYPNWNHNQCKLIYVGELSDGKFRVACWGKDDFGIDKDFDNEKDAVEIYNKLKDYDFVNHQDLYDLGFANF